MKIKIAAVQLAASDNVERNLNAAEALIDEAVSKGAQVVALPETWTCIGEDENLIRASAEPLNGPIVQRMQAKRKVTFQGGPPSVNPSKRALEHKVSMAQKKKTGGAPPQAKRIVSAGIAKVSLPDLPTIPTASTALHV